MFRHIVAIVDDIWVFDSGVGFPKLRDVQWDSSDEDEIQCVEPDTLHINRLEGISRGESQRSPATQSFIHKRKLVRKSKSMGMQLLIDHVEDLVNAAWSTNFAITIVTMKSCYNSWCIRRNFLNIRDIQ